jgi:uncharacterized membrane protein
MAVTVDVHVWIQQIRPWIVSRIRDGLSVMTTTSAPALTGETVLTTAMTSSLRGPILLVAAVVAGLQAGTYFTWSTGVMPGLARVDDRTFVSAVQQMNIAIVSPVFIATFLGAPLLAFVSIFVAGPAARSWVIAATVLAVGTIVISATGNIPLNDALQAAGPVDKIKDLAAARADFEGLWVKLNVARCLTSAGALACLAMAGVRAR